MILVQLEAEVTERTLALKKTRQKMNKKNQQLVESRHKYEDRLRQQPVSYTHLTLPTICSV